tara:strand:- start:4530 stop:6830 length:2301 start_codon:yes stop_codon:yes gene_type:complete
MADSNEADCEMVSSNPISSPAPALFKPAAPIVDMFLPSDTRDMPSLVPLRRPHSAQVEFHQQMKKVAISLPIMKLRNSRRLYASRPADKSSPYFSQAFDGFMSGRRCVASEGSTQAQSLVASETAELTAHAMRTQALDGSMAPRPIGVSLVIPSYCVADSKAIEYIDGMAVYSDGKLNEQLVPITTLCRFTIYGGESSIPMIDTVRRDAFGELDIHCTSLVLRWIEVDTESGEARARAEFISLNSASNATDNAANKLQRSLIKLAETHGVKMPPSMYATICIPSCMEGYFENQIIKASEHFESLVTYEHPFVCTNEMTDCQCTRLALVPNAFVRLSSKEGGVDAAVADTAMHAQLLCADGHVDDASEFVRQYRTGLPMANTTAYENIALHTCGVSVEMTRLGGMVSLYAHSGRSGQPISEPHTTLYMCKAAIVPLSALQEQWNVYSCSPQSILPGIRELGKSMISHFQRGLDMFHRTFSDDRPTFRYPHVNDRRFSPCERDDESISDEDRFFMMAMGIDLRSKRACLGDTISRLMVGGAPQTLIDLMIRMGLQVGLAASLQETFARCIVSIDREENGNQEHQNEVKRLKRVADAALLMGCRKKACVGVPRTTLKKVRSMMKLHSLQAGRSVSKVASASLCPRDGGTSRSLAMSIYSCYSRRMLSQQPHFEEVRTVAETHEDILVVVCKGMGVCMVSPGVPIKAFAIVHGHEIDGICVYEVVTTGVQGCAVACGIGCIFEADDPAVMTIKWLPEDVCLITPLVVSPA